jgi:uncharacterized membrane protein YfcA
MAKTSKSPESQESPVPPAVGPAWRWGRLTSTSATRPILQGVIIGASVTAGAFVGKAVVLRMSIGMFQHVLGGLLLCSGLAMLWGAAGW